MDWIIDPVGSEKQSDGTIMIVLKPDPRKYDEVFEGGSLYGYKDKFSGIIMPLSTLNEINFPAEIPIYYSPLKESDLCKYLREIKSELLDKWDKKYNINPKMKPIEEYLATIVGKDANFVIIYVDMAGSTNLSSNVDPDTNVKINKIFLMQMARAIDNCKGYVFKYVGDCVIGIFPAEDNFTSTCDNAIQSAILMCAVIEKVLNPIFEEKGIPTIGCHIGLDIGSVRIDTMGEENLGSNIDLIGRSMNVTAKIQGQAGFNDILLGRRIFELLHCSLQEGCEEVDLGDNWTIKDQDSDGIYQVYRYKNRLSYQ
ncbi:MAG: adenylate/guanylate cyclase domain-containing protein [Methanocorpusculum sp.]|uniref:adenylate/guanylate cyclase domain-containing protein n=1 Tax=Methanocorpusculum sp. TaxID=2058474 RepID=UPI00271CD578|nr:adenylate/guanylate cyclase domain-containing protein [Methanocorpusculum sp.]MDO9522755.1 adenylate/guanylate cyclase domain-containing protein [Methanocorpusculum sp.]